jgi:hypothetical protein
VLETSRTNRATRSGDNSPHWPISPRLKSPSPSTSTRHVVASTKKSETDGTPPNTSLKRLGSASTPDLPAAAQQLESSQDDLNSRSAPRTPARASSAASPGLETVAESSAPTTPAIGTLLDAYSDRKPEDSSEKDNEPRKPDDDHPAAQKDTIGSGSDGNAQMSGAQKLEPQSNQATSGSTRPGMNMAKRSLTNLTKNKAPESVRSMTVETETVSSVPQASIGMSGERGASSRMNSSGSVRLKPSAETIRPKKDKRKTGRKPPSLYGGTVSSKADIFEAKVASAVDEANSSDSEEAFVYESNPPDRSSRHHSRTPSAASLASQVDRHGNRKRQDARETNHGVSGKRSMKFTNSAYNNNLDGEQGNPGSARGTAKNGNSTPRHHHIGRHGRGGHTSILDNDSPFTQANKVSSPRTSIGNTSKLARPGSPRVANGRPPASPRKAELYGYDIDDEAADDERAPLMGSVRLNRNRHSRRPNSGSIRQIEYLEQRQRNYCSRYGACLIVTLLLFVLCVGAGTFVMALNKPLMDVSVRRLENVLASEQEIMLDLDVRATNPNLFVIVVNELDVNMFAKSSFVGTGSFWRDYESDPSVSKEYTRRRSRRLAVAHARQTLDFDIFGGVDEGTDPIDDPDGEGQTMLLGQILAFDSPLVFEPSPLRRTPTASIGGIRLAKPGNETEEGGSTRWERVLQHPFELIVRGVIKYQLPLSSKTVSASLGSRIKVVPKDDSDGKQPSIS